MKPPAPPPPPTASSARTIYAFGEFELDEPRFELRRAGARLHVEPKVLDLLLLLARAGDRLVPRSEIQAALWPDVRVSESAMWRIIMEARRALGDELQTAIVTVRGRGLRFAATVARSAAATDTGPPEVPQEQGIDPAFVGREAGLAAVGAGLLAALGGRGGAVWLSGEAGIGKSRMLVEVARRARLRGATVLMTSGRQVAGAPPFWLWSELLRSAAIDGGHAPLASAAGLLGRLPPRSGAEGLALFDAVCRQLVEAARARPLVLAIDDLHWADEASLALLDFFAREIGKHPALVVGAYREAELPGDGRARVVGGLLGLTGSIHVRLRGLALDEVARLVEVSAGLAPSAALAAAMLERSAGNPLYVQQLLKTDWADLALANEASEIASTMDLRRDVIEAICRHLDAMSAPARDLLTMAAILGKDFQPLQLGVVTGLASGDVMDRLDEAARANLVAVSSSGQYSFNHALVRDVLRKRLSSAERAARHRAVGERLLEHYAGALDAHASELADHLSRALPGGDPDRAIELAIRAALLHQDLGRPREALRHWEQAARAHTFLPSENRRRTQVQLGLARARRAAGQPSEARDAFLDAAVLARAFEQPAQLAEAALGYAGLAVDAAAAAPRRALLEQARAGLGADYALAALREQLDAALAGPAPSEEEASRP